MSNMVRDVRETEIIPLDEEQQRKLNQIAAYVDNVRPHVFLLRTPSEMSYFSNHPLL